MDQVYGWKTSAALKPQSSSRCLPDGTIGQHPSTGSHASDEHFVLLCNSQRKCTRLDRTESETAPHGATNAVFALCSQCAVNVLQAFFMMLQWNLKLLMK